MQTKVNRSRPHAIQIRVTEAEFQLIRAAADATFAGSIGSFCRQRLLSPMLSNQQAQS
jgi:hypothetical protein